jgi:hypothetical protein
VPQLEQNDHYQELVRTWKREEFPNGFAAVRLVQRSSNFTGWLVRRPEKSGRTRSAHRVVCWNVQS